MKRFWKQSRQSLRKSLLIFGSSKKRNSLTDLPMFSSGSSAEEENFNENTLIVTDPIPVKPLHEIKILLLCAGKIEFQNDIYGLNQNKNKEIRGVGFKIFKVQIDSYILNIWNMTGPQTPDSRHQYLQDAEIALIHLTESG